MTSQKTPDQTTSTATERKYIVIEHLWPTPVGIFDLEGVEDLNTELLEMINSGRTTTSRFDNIWDIDHPALRQLQHRILQAAKETYPRVGGVTRGWVTVYKPNEYTTPHCHPGAFAAASYYIKADEGAGGLLLQDPAAGTMWANYVDGMHSGRVYTRIPVRAGRLILLPGHIVHSTEPNFSGTDRVIIATNLHGKTLQQGKAATSATTDTRALHGAITQP